MIAVPRIGTVPLGQHDTAVEADAIADRMAARLEGVAGIWLLVPEELEELLLAKVAAHPLNHRREGAAHAADEIARIGRDQLGQIGERDAVVAGRSENSRP